MPLDKSDDMGDWIKDFYKSDAPQFKGKSKDKRRQMAIAAKLSAENVLMKDSGIMLSEKRAFILAARQAFASGKKSFVFKEKTYPCTIKEESNLFSELTDLLITKKEQFGKVVETTDDSTGDNVDDGDAPSPDIEDDELKGAANMAKQRYQKFGYEDSDVTGQALPESEVDENIKIKAFNNATDKTKKGLEISKTGGMGGTILIKNKKELKDLETQLAKAKRQHKLAESNFRGLSTKLANDHMKFHTVGKPVVAYVQNTEQGNTAIGDIYFYTDGKNVIVASGNRQDGFGRSMRPEDAIISFEPLKGNLKKFAQDWVRYEGRDYDIKLKKISDKARIFSNRGADNNMAPRGMATTKVKTSDNYREAVEYHDRESMPSAVDDASDVMSSYTKFLKSTKSYN